jgi:hypothetical protein
MEKALTIKCFDACVYNLIFPAWFLQATQAQSKKMFKWLFQFGFHRENQEAIAFLSDALPALIEDTKADWDKSLSDYESGKLSLDKKSLPAEWSGKRKVAEIKKRREDNAALLRATKVAETTHKRSLKLLEQFDETKSEWFR